MKTQKVTYQTKEGLKFNTIIHADNPDQAIASPKPGRKPRPSPHESPCQRIRSHTFVCAVLYTMVQ